MTAPAGDVFPLPAALRAAIIEHARREAPRECCGVLSGRDGRPTAIHAMPNIYPGEDFFEIEPGALFRLYRALDERGEAIVANYHSHPVSPARPSPRDIAYAAWGEIAYLICSLQNPARPELRAFRIADDGSVAELPIVEAAPDG